MQLSIVYQDADIIAINKPSGIPTHTPEAMRDPVATDLVSLIKAQVGGYLGTHQRLDKEVSGIIVFALRKEANPGLARAFEGRGVGKDYLAVVHGTPRRTQDMISAPIAPRPAVNGINSGLQYVPPPSPRPDPRAQLAQTRYRVLATTPDERYSLVALTPETGRTHQLRVHMAHIGTPIVGDPGYDDDFESRPAPHLLLHAHRLRLPHPITTQPITLEAPPPFIYDATLFAKSRGLPGLDLMVDLMADARYDRTNDRALHALAYPANGASDVALNYVLRQAIERRAPLVEADHLPTYRLINGASDGMPGLTVDRFGGVLVASFYTEHADMGERTPMALVKALADQVQPPPDAIYVKYRPRVASRLSDEEQAVRAPDKPAWGKPTGDFLTYENGLAYVIQPGGALGVGLYLDSREMRARVRAWSAGKTVLNTFSYTCGFGVAALAGGATRVVNVDATRRNLAWGADSYRANGLTPDPQDFIDGDVFDWLARFGKRRDLFDIVILDPPSFSTTPTSRFEAARNYDSLVRMAADALAPGGLLIAASNHAALFRRTFRQMVIRGLEDARRPAFTEVGFYAAPALDYPPAPYAGSESHLKVLALRVD